MKDKNNNLFKTCLVSSIIMLSACGGDSDLANPGIKLGSESTVDPLVIENWKTVLQVRDLVERADGGQAEPVTTTSYYALRSGASADNQHVFNTNAITGIGLNGYADATVTSVIDITGTKLAPEISPVITQLNADRAQCEVRNASIENIVEQEACNASHAQQICEIEPGLSVNTSLLELEADKDDEGNVITDDEGNVVMVPVLTDDGNTIVDCANQPDPYSYEYRTKTALVPVPVVDSSNVDPLNIISLRSIYSVDAYGTKLGVESDDTIVNTVQITQNSALAMQFNLGDGEDFWQKTFQAIVDVGGQKTELVLQTVARDPEPTPPIVKFLGEDINNVKTNTYVETSMVFAQFNTRMPVQIIKQGNTDFEVEYAVTGGRNTGEWATIVGEESLITGCDDAGNICVRSGEELKIRFKTAKEDAIAASDSAFSRPYQIKVIAGEKLYVPESSIQYETTYTATTHAWDYVPGMQTNLLFPTLNTASVAAKGKAIRGQFTITPDMKEFSRTPEQGVVVNPATLAEPLPLLPVAATLERSINDGTTWTAVGEPIVLYTGDDAANAKLSNNIMPTSNADVFDFSFNDVELVADVNNKFRVIATANLTYTPPGAELKSSTTEPLSANILHRSTLAGFNFPLGNTTQISHLGDVSLEHEGKNLYMIDSTSPTADENGDTGTHNIIWKYSMDATAGPVCASIPKVNSNQSKLNSTNNYQKAYSNVIQFNHARPDLGGVLVKGGRFLQYWPSLLPDNLLDGGYEDSRLGVRANGNITSSRSPQSRLDHTGRFIYSSHVSRSPSDAGRREAFVVTTEIETVVEDGVVKPTYDWTAAPGPGNLIEAFREGPSTATTFNNGISLDMISFEDEEGNIDEWLLSLDNYDGNVAYGIGARGWRYEDSLGRVNLRKAQLQNPGPSETLNYNIDSDHHMVTLKDEDNNDVILMEAHSIAIDDKRQAAYIVDNSNGDDAFDPLVWSPLQDKQKIYKVDLSTLRDSDTSVLPTETIIDLSIPEGEDGYVATRYSHFTSIKKEPNADLIFAVDSYESSVYIIDPESGDMSILLRSSLTKHPEHEGAICQ